MVASSTERAMQDGYIKMPYLAKETIDPVLLSLPTKSAGAEQPPQAQAKEQFLKTPSTATNSYYSTEGMSQHDSEDEFFTPAPFELRDQLSVGDLLEEAGARLEKWMGEGAIRLYARQGSAILEEGECEEIQLH